MGFGNAGFVAISRQNSFGTATASWDYVPIVSESITTNIEQLIEENIKSRYEKGGTHEGMLTVAGDIVMEAHPGMIGHFLRGCLGQSSQTVVGSAYNTAFLPVQTAFTPNCDLPPYTLQIHRDVGSAWQYTDAVINAMTFEVSAGGLLRATASVLARVSSLMPYTTASFPAGDPWTWDQASLSIGGAANGVMENFSMTIENNVEGVALLDGTKQHGRYKRNGFRMFGFSGTMDFTSQTEYNQFRSQTAQRFLLTFKNATTVASGSTETLILDVPSGRYASYAGGLSGPNRISATFEGTAEWDTTSSYAFKATLVNTKSDYA